MGYLSEGALNSMGFRYLGKNVLISDKASIYNSAQISIGDNSRIDDFCVLAGKITIGKHVHVTVFCNLAGGRAGLTLADFSTLAYGCQVIAQTDDYSGETMTNSTIPMSFKNEKSEPSLVGRFAILGAGSIVLPGVSIGEGVSAGAGTVFVHSADPWGIYVGVPARRIKERSRNLLRLHARFITEND
jgi:acetyltransferase-like isoleucine patch superfamily enzyme